MPMVKSFPKFLRCEDFGNKWSGRLFDLRVWGYLKLSAAAVSATGHNHQHLAKPTLSTMESFRCMKVESDLPTC